MSGRRDTSLNGDEEHDEITSPLLYEKREDEVTKSDLVIGWFLFLILGIAPQLMQNALFSETAIFKTSTPEGKQISASIVTAFMVANIFCLIYIVLQQFCSSRDKILMYVILIGNIVDAVLVGVLWNKTSDLPLLHDSSFMILLTAFFAGALGNTSTMVFFGFAAHYQPILTTALSSGYGLSGLITSCLTIAQNPDSPRFSVAVYFAIMAIIVAFALAVMAVLSHSSFGNKLKNEAPNPQDSGYNRRTSPMKLLLKAAWVPLINMVWVSAITFWIPALIPFMGSSNSGVSYLNGIFLVFPPLGAILAGFYKFYHVSLISVVQTIIFGYIVLPWVKSTHDFLPNPTWLVFILLIVFSLLSGYNTTMIYLLIRKNFSSLNSDAEKVSRWVAFANQLGAMVGIFINDSVIKASVYYSTE